MLHTPPAPSPQGSVIVKDEMVTAPLTGRQAEVLSPTTEPKITNALVGRNVRMKSIGDDIMKTLNKGDTIRTIAEGVISGGAQMLINQYSQNSSNIKNNYVNGAVLTGSYIGMEVLNNRLLQIDKLYLPLLNSTVYTTIKGMNSGSTVGNVVFDFLTSLGTQGSAITLVDQFM